MSQALDDAAHLAAQLIARRWLPRNHALVRRALIDTELWAALGDRLAQVGLKVIDNLYADHISVAMLRPAEVSVFGETGLAANNNLDLPRDGVALLIVLWSLIVLPKRQRQVARAEAKEEGQGEFFATDKPLPLAASVSPTVSYRSLLADFGNQLGKKMRLDSNLKLLERNGFIIRRGEDIAEGPLLDLLLDYDTLAPRILDGALADVLARSTDPAAAPLVARLQAGEQAELDSET
ncbi:hypothetical protein PEC18_18045 [Paucibacter sp. O1-1]|uniref:hypothetical protein n=1 Tax=Roseateles TaxID=93681 RepID=UPI0010F745E7|nr:MULTISPECIES: hypothetical protein [unclassified Roseateles]MCU7372708.1 hypothetical protein [Paucibacter sp. O1-1]MCX2863165.1 hypothetical protein [Paucibacter sp. PLA-PC-4]MCZ7882748.1 hypothetical protein [Paucibacter sp. M5-1]MDA3827702.1 hypothetical protein [Paucibacter sp. O1-1]